MVTRDPSDRREIEQLQTQVERLGELVENMQRDSSADDSRHQFLAITTCGENDSPQYPDPPGNVFRIAFIDAAFRPLPGFRDTIYKLRNAPTTKYGATARNICTPGWVPEGTPVIAHWQRCWGDEQNGEWWFSLPRGGALVKAQLSKPLRHDDPSAYFKPGAVDVDSGLPVSVFTADNTLLRWQGLENDYVLLRQAAAVHSVESGAEPFSGWFVFQPQMHGVCVVVDVVDSPSLDTTHPGALTKVELMASMNFGVIPNKVCDIVEYSDCVGGSAGSDSGSGATGWIAPDYAFAYDVNSCCDAGSLGSGSVFSGGSESGSCETGEGMTGEF